ncbi:hypothetical protein B0A67_15880, partial [Flavobacterium aquidurense]|uniref:ATP-binding protein n=1 Tax=Flavobacterium aquidurense TaxID=362413 RepID=UPI000B5B9726
MIILQAPKYLTKNFVPAFLRKVEHTFNWKNRAVTNVRIDLSQVIEIDILGLLIIYKYLDYTFTHHCFRRPNLFIDDYINESWAKYEFYTLIQAFISDKKIPDRAFKEFKIKLDDKFIIAPQALLRNSNYTNEYLQNEFIPKISEYYNNKQKVTDLIFSCFSEILLNFWEHAVQDTQSVILADGNKSKIEIACADTGIGIISNLKKVFFNSVDTASLLGKSVQKGVTSKPNTYHMGFGLWIVNELVKLNNGKLHLYSEGFYYYNDYGKIKTGPCSYWPGTIIYISLDLTNPKSLSDL